MSIIDFFLYKADKTKAKKGMWRTKEATLLWTGFLGGALGAIAAMKIFRHKTKHFYFWVVNILGLVWQAGMLVLLIFGIIKL